MSAEQSNINQGLILLDSEQIDTPNTLLDLIEGAWGKRESAIQELLTHLSCLTLFHARQLFPSAVTVCLREDTSHLPAHGHVDDILDSQGASLLAPEFDHDISADLDEAAWEIYYVSPQAFTRDEDGIRRLRISIEPI
jgi:hypothetical protein